MQFNERTKEMKGTTIPVEITIYSDRTFEFITKSPPAAVLLKQAAGIASGSAVPNKTKVGTVTAEQVKKIAETKFADLNARDIEHACRVIAGTARSMGVEIKGVGFSVFQFSVFQLGTDGPRDDRMIPVAPRSVSGQSRGSWKLTSRPGGALALPNTDGVSPRTPPPAGGGIRKGGSSPGAIGMAKQSKRYRALREKIRANGPVPLPEAVRLLKSFNTTKFNQTVEVSTHLGIDPKQTDQNVRGSVALPHGIGKSVRVAVFAKGENAEKARAAGADIVGADDLAQQVKGGTMDFDVALATPDMMGIVGPLGRVLGPRGLMPSPRSGTVTTDIASAVLHEFKAAKIEFRNDKGGNVAVAVGKLAFSEEQLADNINAFLGYLRSLKPATAKGTYIRSITLSATMSPGIPTSA